VPIYVRASDAELQFGEKKGIKKGKAEDAVKTERP
jgi:hypothetical protein